MIGRSPCLGPLSFKKLYRLHQSHVPMGMLVLALCLIGQRSFEPHQHPIYWVRGATQPKSKNSYPILLIFLINIPGGSFRNAGNRSDIEQLMWRGIFLFCHSLSISTTRYCKVSITELFLFRGCGFKLSKPR